MKLKMNFLHLILLIGIVIAPLLNAEVIQYHPNSPAYIGGNFDPSKPGRAFPECLQRTSVRAESLLPNVDPGSPARTQFYTKKISSRQELYRHLNVSLSLSGSYGLFSADFSGSLEQENTFNEESFTWIIQGYSNFGRFILESVKLTKDAEKYKDNPVAFRNMCGTDYVGIEVRAVQAAAVFTIKNLSQTDKKVLEASFNASYGPGGGGPLSIGGDTKYSNFVKTAAQYGQIEVNVHAIGGEGVSALSPIITNVDKPDEVLKTLEKYFSNLTLSRSAPVSYNTGSLQSLINRPTIEMDVYNKFIADAFLHYEDLGAELIRLSNIVRSKEDWMLSESDEKMLNLEINTLTKIRQDTLNSALNCKHAFDDVKVSAQERRKLCTAGSTTFLSYVSKISGIEPKPYYLRYFVTNELIPNEEVLNFSVRGKTLKNVQIVKKLNLQSGAYEAVNSIEINKNLDGSLQSGTSITMSEIQDTELPIGIRIEMNSGKIYWEQFVFTRAPHLQLFIGENIEDKKLSLEDKEKSKIKEDFLKAYESGNLLPESWKE